MLTKAAIVLAETITENEFKNKIPDRIEFLFNPNTIGLKYSAQYEEIPIVSWVKNKKGKWTKKVDPKIDYTGPGATELSFNLIFDSTEKRGSVDAGTSVKQEYVDKLLQFFQPGVKEGEGRWARSRPPKCRFDWGDLATFGEREELFFVRSVDVTYLFFAEDGTPLRAKVTLSLTRELNDKKGTNPTSVGEARKIHVVEAGQTLDWIAYKEYQDPKYWRDIAEMNNIANPRKLQPGQVLKLPLLGD